MINGSSRDYTAVTPRDPQEKWKHMARTSCIDVGSRGTPRALRDPALCLRARKGKDVRKQRFLGRVRRLWTHAHL